jgi:hypothetical protein
VFAVLVLYGSARAFMMPASQAVLRNLVPTRTSAQAVALSSSTFHVAVIAGPVLGGLLYVFGPNVVYLVSSVLLALSVLLMAGTERAAGHEQSAGQLAHPARRPALRVVAPDRAGRDLARPVRRAVRRRHRPAAGLCARRAARRPDQPGPAAHGARRRRRAVLDRAGLLPDHAPVGAWMFGGVAVFGLATVAWADRPPASPVALAALFLLGAGDMVSVYVRHLLVQYETPDEIRGRVSAVNSVFIGASNELGEFESGLTASWFGLVRAIVCSAAPPPWS